MPRIKCFNIIKGTDLESSFEGISENIPEFEQRELALKSALDYHKKLHTELQDFKKSISPNPKAYRPEKYIAPNFTEQIKAIKEKYKPLVEDKKKDAPLVGKEDVVREDAEVKKGFEQVYNDYPNSELAGQEGNTIGLSKISLDGKDVYIQAIEYEQNPNSKPVAAWNSKGENIASASFKKNDDGTWYSMDSRTNKSLQRKGIMNAIYDLAEKSLGKIVESKDQTLEAKLFWKKRKEQKEKNETEKNKRLETSSYGTKNVKEGKGITKEVAESSIQEVKSELPLNKEVSSGFGIDITDKNGIKIKEGDTVSSLQPSGGILPSDKATIGVVEKTKDSFGDDALQIRFRNEGRDFDQFVLLSGKINEVVQKKIASNKKQDVPKFQKGNTRFKTITTEAYKVLLDRLKKAFPKVQIEFFNEGNINEILGDTEGLRQLMNREGTVYGFVKGDTIYFNENEINANSPNHEYGHIWQQMLPNTFKQGIELLKSSKAGQALIQKIKSNPAYANNSQSEIEAEALVTAMGDKGESVFNNAPNALAKFKQWVNDFFKRLGDKLGIAKLSPDYKFDKFVRDAVGDILGGKEIVQEQITIPKTSFEAIKDNVNKTTTTSLNSLAKREGLSNKEVINDFYNWVNEKVVKFKNLIVDYAKIAVASISLATISFNADAQVKNTTSQSPAESKNLSTIKSLFDSYYAENDEKAPQEVLDRVVYLWKMYGSPTINTSKKGDDVRAFYNPTTNTLEDITTVDDFIAELSHGLQFSSGVELDQMEYDNPDTYDSIEYKRKGSAEYDAHTIIEPILATFIFSGKTGNDLINGSFFTDDKKLEGNAILKKYKLNNDLTKLSNTVNFQYEPSELTDLVKELRDLGDTDAEIKSLLLEVGNSEASIDTALGDNTQEALPIVENETGLKQNDFNAIREVLRNPFNVEQYPTLLKGNEAITRLAADTQQKGQERDLAFEDTQVVSAQLSDLKNASLGNAQILRQTLGKDWKEKVITFFDKAPDIGYAVQKIGLLNIISAEVNQELQSATSSNKVDELKSFQRRVDIISLNEARQTSLALNSRRLYSEFAKDKPIADILANFILTKEQTETKSAIEEALGKDYTDEELNVTPRKKRSKNTNASPLKKVTVKKTTIAKDVKDSIVLQGVNAAEQIDADGNKIKMSFTDLMKAAKRTKKWTKCK